MIAADDPTRRIGRAGGNDGVDRLFRCLAWANLAVLATFVIQVWLVQIVGIPGPGEALAGGGDLRGWLLVLMYPLAALVGCGLVLRTPVIGLREDADRITAFNFWLIRGAFFAVLYVGLVDAAISFFRVEGMLGELVGAALETELGRPQFRGVHVHLPLIALGFLTAFFTRTLGFTWLALMIVVSELLIVITRFIFSYEQSFMGDLVRFWYAALFLFASAYTLLEEGHVRVDVFYATFGIKLRGLVNAVGAIALGTTLCWTILVLGMGSRTSIIMAPLLNFEVTQTNFGMYVKYLMAGFLGIFAISMMIQFTAMMLDAVADRRGDPGHKEHEGAAIS
ncbi:TRAP transporter small permease subunit [uncultured Albimonas sp.]|uniref:TRAP transporter small permease subunit n=1 Tax=uncultured Albimonas sp. TaxID=1331701 RepID=UPI0030EC07CD|tara:strand:- start:8288 stop:9298 length:1011 start_codon:yes stop_codon:yes gene_type:complete